VHGPRATKPRFIDAIVVKVEHCYCGSA
jgi:hypothetical protein